MSGVLHSPNRFCAIALALAIAACTTETKAPPPAPIAPPPPKVAVVKNPLDRDLPSYMRLPGMAPDVVPVRVGIILPFTSNSAPTRALAQSMMKAAELAMFTWHAGLATSGAIPSAKRTKKPFRQASIMTFGPDRHP